MQQQREAGSVWASLTPHAHRFPGVKALLYSNHAAPLMVTLRSFIRRLIGDVS